MTENFEPALQRRNNVDRRTVLRSAAWALPVMAVAVAAPATAASGAVFQPSLALDSGFNRRLTTTIPGRSLSQAPWWVNEQVMFAGVSGQIRPTIPAYTTPSQSVTNIIVTVSVPQSAGFTLTAPTVTGSGWTAGSPTASGGVVTYTFLYAGSIDTTGNRYAPQLNYVLPANSSLVNSSVPAFSVVVNANAPGALGAPTATSSV